MKVASAVVIPLLFVLSSCGEDIESRYSNATAAADGVKNGWIPRFLPPSATNIEESHNLDTNAAGGTFCFRGDDVGPLKRQLTPLTAGEAKKIRLPPEAKGSVLYKYPYDFGATTIYNVWIVAVDWKRNTAIYWNDKL
jgi:hypothetical protein